MRLIRIYSSDYFARVTTSFIVCLTNGAFSLLSLYFGMLRQPRNWPRVRPFKVFKYTMRKKHCMPTIPLSLIQSYLYARQRKSFHYILRPSTSPRVEIKTARDCWDAPVRDSVCASGWSTCSFPDSRGQWETSASRETCKVTEKKTRQHFLYMFMRVIRHRLIMMLLIPR